MMIVMKAQQTVSEPHTLTWYYYYYYLLVHITRLLGVSTRLFSFQIFRQEDSSQKMKLVVQKTMNLSFRDSQESLWESYKNCHWWTHIVITSHRFCIPCNARPSFEETQKRLSENWIAKQQKNHHHQVVSHKNITFFLFLSLQHESGSFSAWLPAWMMPRLTFLRKNHIHHNQRVCGIRSIMNLWLNESQKTQQVPSKCLYSSKF